MDRLSLGPVLLLAILLPLPGCVTYPREYSAEAIEGWVVDGETGKPIEGVNVTANWELEIDTPGGRSAVGQMMIMETVTDAAGRYYFPAWGPKPVPPYDMPDDPALRQLMLPPHFGYEDPNLTFLSPDTYGRREQTIPRLSRARVPSASRTGRGGA